MREHLGMFVGLVDRFGIIGPSRCDRVLARLVENGGPAVPAMGKQPQSVDEDDWRASARVRVIDLIGGDARYGIDHERPSSSRIAEGKLGDSTGLALTTILLPTRKWRFVSIEYSGVRDEPARRLVGRRVRPDALRRGRDGLASYRDGEWPADQRLLHGAPSGDPRSATAGHRRARLPDRVRRGARRAATALADDRH